MSHGVRKHIPNALTVLRLVLAGAFFTALNLYRYPDEHVLWANIANALFILAAITDAYDGHLARKWNVTSTFGRLMDPFCDKILILGAFIYLSGPRFVVPEWVANPDSIFTMSTGVYPWMVVLMLARELLVTGIRGVVEGAGGSAASLWAGKAKMILQAAITPVVLFLVVNVRTHEHAWAMNICHGLVYLTIVVTVWSGVPYVLGLKGLMQRKSNAEGSG